VNDLLRPFIAAPRVLIEAQLKPVIGTRIQPTGFPNLGAAEYTLPASSKSPIGPTMLLLESPQSIANRLETVMWEAERNAVVPALDGLPYVRATIREESAPEEYTDSIREAHRLNSPYLREIWPKIRERAEIREAKKVGPGKGKAAKEESLDSDDDKKDSSSVDIRKLARSVFFYDPNSVLHGVFLTTIVGQARLTRMLSGFIEARNVSLVASGGVKNDRIDPSGKRFKGGAAAGYGNVPYARTEYTAETIEASFSIDLTLLKSYGLGPDAEVFLTALALWKVARFLGEPMRLRTACDLELTGPIAVRRPDSAALPAIETLETTLRESLERCAKASLFATPPITDVVYP